MHLEKKVWRNRNKWEMKDFVFVLYDKWNELPKGYCWKGSSL